MKKSCFALIFAFSITAQAEIRVAFFTALTKDGRLIQFEPGGQFSHVAISHRDGWIHVDPVRGVEFMRALGQIGHLSRILTNPSLPGLSEVQVSRYIGLPYDRAFAWGDENSTYCSKLVGNLLGVAPLPMGFKSEGWIGIRDLPKGNVGLSPDDIYANLLERGFKKSHLDCSDILRGSFRSDAED